jgi:hypothetical protein
LNTIHVDAYMHVYIHTFVSIYVSMCLCIHVSMYPCIYVSMYLYIHVYSSVCMFLYLYIYADSFLQAGGENAPWIDNLSNNEFTLDGDVCTYHNLCTYHFLALFIHQDQGIYQVVCICRLFQYFLSGRVAGKQHEVIMSGFRACLNLQMFFL